MAEENICARKSNNVTFYIFYNKTQERKLLICSNSEEISVQKMEVKISIIW